MNCLRRLAVLTALSGSACHGGGGGGAPAPVTPPLATAPQVCVNGRAGDFACLGINLHRRIAHSDLGDELDELRFNVRTRTHVFDVSDLDSPAYLFAYEGPTAATDHNLYVLGARVFEANYAAGLTVLEIGNLANAEIMEVAFFDTYPASEAAGFTGAWSVYPYLASGTLLVNDVSNGLFVLGLQ